MMKKAIFDKYVNAIAKQFNFTLDEMFMKSKEREKVDARQLLYYLCMERPIRISYIVRFLKEYNYDVGHSTIIHGYKEAKKIIESDYDYGMFIKNILKNSDFQTKISFKASETTIKTDLSVNKNNISKEKAIKELKNIKELLDLDLINKEEYEKKSKELKKIILEN